MNFAMWNNNSEPMYGCMQNGAYQASNNGNQGFDSVKTWAVENKLNPRTVDALETAGCDSLDAVKSLLKEDIPTLQLPIAQQRLLEKALGFHSHVVQPMQRQPQNPMMTQSNDGQSFTQLLQQPLPMHSQQYQQAAASNMHMNTQAAGGMRYTMQLNRNQGKPTHLDILDHLPHSIEYEEIRISGGDAGHPELVLKSGPLKPKLEKVTIAQWNCANMTIMDKLVQSGVLGDVGIRQYMNYTYTVNELAMRYEWHSVLHYDREYRSLQSQHSFPWGSPVEHLCRVFLKEKPITSYQSNAAPVSSTKAQQKAPKKLSVDICRLYNQSGQCSYGAACKFAHLCSVPGCLQSHPRCEHKQPAQDSKNV